MLTCLRLSCVALRAVLSQWWIQGVNMTALREIKLLRELHNPRMVQLLDVFSHKANLYLVSTHLRRAACRLLQAVFTRMDAGVRVLRERPGAADQGPQDPAVCGRREGVPAHDPDGPAVLPRQLGAAPRHQAQHLPHQQGRQGQAVPCSCHAPCSGLLDEAWMLMQESSSWVTLALRASTAALTGA